MILAIFSYLCTDTRTNYYIGIRDLKGTIRPAVRSAGFKKVKGAGSCERDPAPGVFLTSLPLSLFPAFPENS